MNQRMHNYQAHAHFYAIPHHYVQGDITRKVRELKEDVPHSYSGAQKLAAEPCLLAVPSEMFSICGLLCLIGRMLWWQ